MDKKTARKNKTNLQVNWPSDDAFWTVKDLLAANPQFVEITLRVRLANSIKKDNTVAVIGDKMNSHGRPEMVCAMRQKDGSIKQSTIDAAKASGIRITESIPVIVANITKSVPQTTSVAPAPSVNLNPTQKSVTV